MTRPSSASAHAAALARARAASLTPAQRSDIARNAALARWKNRDGKGPRKGEPKDSVERRQGARNSTRGQKRIRRLQAVQERLARRAVQP